MKLRVVQIRPECKITELTSVHLKDDRHILTMNDAQTTVAIQRLDEKGVVIDAEPWLLPLSSFCWVKPAPKEHGRPDGKAAR